MEVLTSLVQHTAPTTSAESGISPHNNDDRRKGLGASEVFHSSKSLSRLSMRELDAEILEQGICDTGSLPPTPMLLPLNSNAKNNILFADGKSGLVVEQHCDGDAIRLPSAANDSCGTEPLILSTCTSLLDSSINRSSIETLMLEHNHDFDENEIKTGASRFLKNDKTRPCFFIDQLKPQHPSLKHITSPDCSSFCSNDHFSSHESVLKHSNRHSDANLLSANIEAHGDKISAEGSVHSQEGPKTDKNKMTVTTAPIAEKTSALHATEQSNCASLILGFPQRHESSQATSTLKLIISSDANVNNSEKDARGVDCENDDCRGAQELDSNQRSSHHRSLSVDRKLNEAMQYAEAVGEIPPIDEKDLNMIIDEDSSSESDDDEKNVSTSLEQVRKNSLKVHDRGGKFVATPPPSPMIQVSRPVLVTPMLRQTSMTVADLKLDAEASTEGNEMEESVVLSYPPRRPVFDNQSLPKSRAAYTWIPQPPRAVTDSDCNGKCSQIKLGRRHSWIASCTSADATASISNFEASLLCKKQGLTGELNQEIFCSFAYRGIRHNPPEITKRGLSRGNHAQLHRKAWLEVSDKFHRYGKNLRLYYKHWESLGHPTNMFFEWLDSKGEAAGQPLPNLPECPRSELDSDTVLYITNPEIQEQYALRFCQMDDGTVQIVNFSGNPVCTGPDGWIFVLRDHELYGAQKVTSKRGKLKQRFHHSSFFGGKAVAAAGILITDDCGRLTKLYPHSGHYRPGEAHMQRMLFHLYHSGVDLTSFDVDMQQIMHVSRENREASTPTGGEVDDADEAALDSGGKAKKAKKVDSLHMQPAVEVAYFLGHKALMIGELVFAQIQKIKRLDVTTVREALHALDDGGFWARPSLAATL